MSEHLLRHDFYFCLTGSVFCGDHPVDFDCVYGFCPPTKDTNLPKPQKVAFGAGGRPLGLQPLRNSQTTKQPWVTGQICPHSHRLLPLFTCQIGSFFHGSSEFCIKSGKMLLFAAAAPSLLCPLPHSCFFARVFAENTCLSPKNFG